MRRERKGKSKEKEKEKEQQARETGKEMDNLKTGKKHEKERK